MFWVFLRRRSIRSTIAKRAIHDATPDCLRADPTRLPFANVLFGASPPGRSCAVGKYRNGEGSIFEGHRVASPRTVNDVTISHGANSYSIDEFASVMARLEISKTLEDSTKTVENE